MIRNYFSDGFFKSTSGTKFSYGKDIYENDLIENLEYKILGNNKITISSNVISENLYNTYNVYINLELDDFTVNSISCTCDDFEKNELKKKNYACKHISAAFLKFLDYADKDKFLSKIIEDRKIIDNILDNNKEIDNPLSLLLNEDTRKDVFIDIYLNKNSWSNKITAEFKIGIKSLSSRKKYVIKDINNFLINIYNNIPISFSKDFEFSNKDYKFSSESNKIFSFIETIKELEIYSTGFKRSQDKLINKKEIIIPNGLLKSFLLSIKGNKVYLNSGFYSREVETEILECDIPLPIQLNEEENSIDLIFPRGLPIDLDGKCNVLLYDTVIYIPSTYQSEKLLPYIKTFKNMDSFKFKLKDKDKIFRKLIPSIKNMTDSLMLNDKISNQIIIAKPKFKFYFHRDDYIRLTIKVCYKEYEFNILNDYREKFIYRDTILENRVITLAKNLLFQPIEDKTFVFIGSEDKAFEFFKNNIDSLRPIGEIFYSDSFKGNITLDSNSFNIEISRGREEYFEFKYSVSNIDEEEFYNILRSFKDNKKYYKLNSGDYLDLEEIKLKEFLTLLNSLKTSKIDNKLEFNKNKSLYITEKLKEITNDYTGKEYLESIRDNTLNLDYDLNLNNINAKLRDYQLYGVKWMNQLNSLGFGGILGDEMGLGKTLQSIAFISSQKNKKTLIVSPTSLIYNWRDEFLKFSPNTKVKINIGTKKNRKITLDNISNIDVIITTYNLLRNDIDLYEKLDFDFMFIDEAQYIKNSDSKNSKACKRISSNSKFALTGTPIENNLMELWSIFDFIMPGYLWDKNTFNSKYNRNLSEDPILIKDLRLLIDPFILRRFKRDVLKELPDKIEKIIKVDMTKEQKKVYSSYNKYIKELINKKEIAEEFKQDSIEILSYITKLRQIAIDPSLVINDFEGESGKLIALKEILEDTISNGHKVLVFSQFTSALKKIKSTLNANDISTYYIDGSISSKKRLELVNKFNEDETNVFLISLKAGGTGLNLTSADIVIHFDPWWNPAAENQATDRAHRIGQKNIVEVIKLVSEGTVEEKILSLQERKKDLINNLIDENSLSNNLLINLKRDDILKLLKK
ncbi:DEAD/DEAH box helicase [Clostridium thermobutyricum]